eukprot:m.5964 g.5964  ORF g.5964 m.5964 type:complete len:779 (-) comp3453_c0_seq1:107-2443(-)
MTVALLLVFFHIVDIACCISSPPRITNAYDTTATLIPVDSASQLQQLISLHKVIRLESLDYTTIPNVPDNVTVATGTIIYGLPGTKFPGIIIQPGSVNITISNIDTKLLYFPPSATNTVTKYCTFQRLVGPHVLFDNGKVSDLLFVSLTTMTAPFVHNNSLYSQVGGGIEAIGNASVTNCRFIRSMVHSPGATLCVNLTLVDGHPSPNGWRGNTLLWQNSLGAMQDTFYAHGADELTIVGSDVESYGAAFHKSVVTTRNTNAVRFYGLHGRVDAHGPDSAAVSGLFDIDANNIQLLSPVISRNAPNGTVLDPEIVYSNTTRVVLQLLGTNYSTLDKGVPESVLRVLANNNNGVIYNNKHLRSNNSYALSDQDQITFQQTILPLNNSNSAWSLPNLTYMDTWITTVKNTIANEENMSNRDDGPMIQALIDTTPNKTVVLKAGVYYIQSPLRLKKMNYLIGEGPDKTIIRALNASMSMIVGGGDGASGQINVAMLTLEGASYGIHLNQEYSGPHFQCTDSFLSHILFLNISVAGIFLDDIFGLDNNLISDLAFESCNNAFLQYAPPSQREPGKTTCLPAYNNPNIDYMDKTVFYRVRITNCDSGFHLSPCRADNLNMWFECEFHNISGNALYLYGNSEPIIASSVFTNVGTPISEASATLTNSKIVVGNMSVSVLPVSSYIEGVNVTIGEDFVVVNTTLFPNRSTFGDILMMSHCNIADIPVSTMGDKSIFINNYFHAESEKHLNVVGLVLLNSSNTTILLCGNSSQQFPQSKLLFGGAW